MEGRKRSLMRRFRCGGDLGHQPPAELHLAEIDKIVRTERLVAMISLRIISCTPLLAYFAFGSSASAAIIFSDDFSVAAALNGTAPDTRPGTETWVSSSTTAGGVLPVAATTTSYLPWTPTAGNIYSLSVDATSSATSTSSTYAGFGFFSASATIANTYALSGANTPWAFMRTGNPTASSIGDTAFRPMGSSGADQNTNLTVTSPRRLELVLNTTDTDAITTGVQWSLAFLVDGIQVGATYTYSETESNQLLANITSVGLTGATNGNSVSYDNFLLQTIPEPSHFMLAASGLGLLAIRRRK